MLNRTAPWLIGLASLAFLPCLRAAPAKVTFSQSAQSLEAYDYIEVSAQVEKPDAANPFLDVTLSGSFGREDHRDKTNVEGFCDAADGSVSRLRFAPATAGDHSYSITYRQGQFEQTHSGTFHATAGNRKGPIR